MSTSDHPEPAQANQLKELIEFQSSMFEKASTYTKIILGLGYGGFFTAWSGAKQHLSPKILVASALCMTVSLLLFITYEIWGAMVTSHLSMELAEALDRPISDVAGALEEYRNKTVRARRPLVKAWKVIFPASAITGLLGALILISAFLVGLFRMYSSIPTH